MTVKNLQLFPQEGIVECNNNLLSKKKFQFLKISLTIYICKFNCKNPFTDYGKDDVIVRTI